MQANSRLELPTRALRPFSPFSPRESTPDPRNRNTASGPDPLASGREVRRALRSFHEQHFASSPSVSRLITFPPTSWLLLPWQTSPPGKVRGDAAHPLISTPHRLRTSEIPMPKSVYSAVTHRCHHRPALPFRDWQLVLISAEKISSTFVPRGYAVLYPISRSGT